MFVYVFFSLNDSTPLLAVRKIAEYFAEPNKRESLVQYFDEKLATINEDLHEMWLISGATIYYNEENYEAALKLLHDAESLECKALYIQTLLKVS